MNSRSHPLRCAAAWLLIIALCAAAHPIPIAAGLADNWNNRTQQKNDQSDTTSQADLPTDSDPDPNTNSEYSNVPQLTQDDLEQMNNGDVAMLFSDEGYLTFLRGRFYDGIVENEEDGVLALRGIASLLGLSKGSEFFAVYGERNAEGYTYITYKQRYGDVTLENAVLKIVIDSSGYTAGLVSSFVPNAGIAEPQPFTVTKEEAENAVRRNYPDIDFHFYTDSTRKTSLTIGGNAIHAWAVFTDCPTDFGTVEGRAYIEHLIAYNGSYLTYLSVITIEEIVLGDDVQQANALSWFDGKTADTYTGVVTSFDGSQEEITVPVVRDADGIYYLADAERHILLADCQTYMKQHEYKTFNSTSNDSWPDHYLYHYLNYIRVYDFYKAHGLTSVDGFGTPLLILTDYCDQYGIPVDNAGFLGYTAGWAVFAASAVNNYGEGLDVMGHEFTHGVLTYVMGDSVYQNETGAVNEAFADIMGNLIEISLAATEDTEWLIAENSGRTLRSMSAPWFGEQPVTVGGTFYIPPTETPTMENDLGGVHTNSSLMNYVAWQLCDRGMTLEDAFYLWKEAMNLMTPLSGFREVRQALVFAARMQQLDTRWIPIINMVCEQCGY